MGQHFFFRHLAIAVGIQFLESHRFAITRPCGQYRGAGDSHSRDQDYRDEFGAFHIVFLCFRGPFAAAYMGSNDAAPLFRRKTL
jgi:hypothetical protein